MRQFDFLTQRFTQGSLDGVISPTPASPRVPTASKNSVEDVTSSGGLNNFHTTFKRRILPPRRRKTITALISPKDLQSHSPLASTKWYAPSCSASATNPEHPRAPNSKLDPEQSDPLRNPSSFTRWRPWVPNHPNSSTCSPVLDQPMLRVMAVDERAGHLRNQLYPARPSLTAGELCNMLAFEMKIFDPKEFGLFAHREGKEVLLDDHIHLIDFIETSNHGSNQIFGNQRSPTVFTANSTRHPLRLVNKTVQRSLSSRSNSPPSSSSSGSYSHGIKKPERSNSFSVARWLMRKRNGLDVGGVVVPANELRSVRSQLKPTTSADALGLLPSTPHQTMGGEPVLIYKRITGVFAISERAFSDHRYKLQSSPQKQMSPCSGKL
ncbi:unnamed protein product [Dicrocoelium dendriticum]|nr:unnamed protein product [Dicrocoelium dendriticum]